MGPNAHANNGLNTADWALGGSPFLVCFQSVQHVNVPSNPGTSRWGRVFNLRTVGVIDLDEEDDGVLFPLLPVGL